MKFFDKEVVERIGKQKFIANNFENALANAFGGDIRIMGGAPRDWDALQSAKDIDIFVFTKLDEKTIKKELLKIDSAFVIKPLNEFYLGNPKLVQVWELNYYGETIQVIFTNVPTLDVLKCFPVSISMIWWKQSSGGFYKTNAYSISRDYEVIIKTNQDTYENESYIQKVKNKFPLYTYYENFNEFLFKGHDNDVANFNDTDW